MTFLFEGTEREYLLNLSSNYPTAIYQLSPCFYRGFFVHKAKLFYCLTMISIALCSI